jgi:hypothetical protein
MLYTIETFNYTNAIYIRIWYRSHYPILG